MKYQKMTNLLDETNKSASKYVTENWIEIDNKMKIKTIMLRSMHPSKREQFNDELVIMKLHKLR